MNRKVKIKNAFTLAEGGQSPLLYGDEGTQGSPIKSLSLRERVVAVARQGLTATGEGANAFTLAEVLITLGVIGLVAAMTMPTLVTNIQERVRKEQVRTVKYKLTKATDSMKSQDKISPYATTEAFINELKKHFAISKICQNNDLKACWPTDTINTPDGAISVNSIKNGVDIKALALGTAQTETMGIVTGDGTPMILLYSPVCTPLDPVKTYTWSVVDGKPETNATTNCISAIFDINGSKGPNKIGTDVRTFNSLFGSKQFGATSITKAECENLKGKLGLKYCYNGDDYYAGAVKACHDIGLHLPSMQTLANLAGARYGRTDISAYTLIMKNGFIDENNSSYPDCRQYYVTHDGSGRLAITDNIICIGKADGSENIPNGVNSPFSEMTDSDFWSNTEFVSNTEKALARGIQSTNSTWYAISHSYNYAKPLCVGD